MNINDAEENKNIPKGKTDPISPKRPTLKGLVSSLVHVESGQDVQLIRGLEEHVVGLGRVAGGAVGGAGGGEALHHRHRSVVVLGHGVPQCQGTVDVASHL